MEPLSETLPATGWSRALHHAESESSSFPPGLAGAARRSGLESWWVLPLEGERGLQGLLLLAWEGSVEIDPGDWARAQALTESLGLLIERLRERLGRGAGAGEP